MYPDGARQTAAEHHRLPRPGGPCMCHGCDPPDSRRHGTGAGPRPPAPTRSRDHPATPDGRRLTPLAGAAGRPPGEDRAESHRSPQRRPVFVASGPYPDLPGYLSPGRWDPWDPRPAQWTHPGAPERTGARHYASVREQCGCVSRGGGGGGGGGGRPFNGTLHTFNGRPPPPLPPPPPEFRGQGDSLRRTSDGVAVREEGEGVGGGEEKSGEEGKQPRTGREHGRADRQQRTSRPRIHPGYVHVPNGPPGRRVSSETRERGSRQQQEDWSWRPLRLQEEGGYSVPGASHRGFFSTEVPQKHLSYSRRKGSCVPPPPSTTHSQETTPSPSQDRPQGQVSDPARPGTTVHEQIRQVVMNLEDVLGGLKQVHWEMKEVVDRIDRLTANMDLGDEIIAIPPSNVPADSHIPHRLPDLGPAPAPALALAPNSKPPSVQNHVFLRTNAPSPVHVASVVKTNRIPPPSGPAVDGVGRKRPQLVSNGHLPHLCPPKYSDLQDPWRRGPDPEVGNGAGRRSPGPRTQKPPPYPHNGRCGKGPAPPPIPVKTQTPYLGRRRQNTSMV